MCEMWIKSGMGKELWFILLVAYFLYFEVPPKCFCEMYVKYIKLEFSGPIF